MFILIRSQTILSLTIINNLTNSQIYYSCHNPFSATVSLSASLLSAHSFLFHIKDMSAKEKVSSNKCLSTNVVLIYTFRYTKKVNQDILNGYLHLVTVKTLGVLTPHSAPSLPAETTWSYTNLLKLHFLTHPIQTNLITKFRSKMRPTQEYKLKSGVL